MPSIGQKDTVLTTRHSRLLRLWRSAQEYRLPTTVIKVRLYSEMFTDYRSVRRGHWGYLFGIWCLFFAKIRKFQLLLCSTRTYKSRTDWLVAELVVCFIRSRELDVLAVHRENVWRLRFYIGSRVTVPDVSWCGGWDNTDENIVCFSIFVPIFAMLFSLLTNLCNKVDDLLTSAPVLSFFLSKGWFAC